MQPKLYNRHHGDAPADAVYIGRGTPWGNPFKIPDDGDRAEVVRKFAEWFRGQPALVERARAELRGRHLVCSCAPARCHGDILLSIANGHGGPTWQEEHRHRCEVRQILAWRVERGREWVMNFINGTTKVIDGRVVRDKKGLRDHRGSEAAERLMIDVLQQWERGNRGATDDWRS